MHAESVEYHHDGNRYVGHLALPDGDDIRAAVLVCHEGPGLDEHAKQRAERLAGLGYVAFALDYHGDGQPLDMSEVRSRLDAADGGPRAHPGARQRRPRRAAERIDAPITRRSRSSATASAGRWPSNWPAAAPTFVPSWASTPGLSTARPQDAANITCPVLVCIGADDPMIPAEQRLAFEDEMRAADVDWRVNVYGRAVHSFTNERADELGFPGIAYDGPTDARSWRAMLDLFDEVLS